MKCSAIVDRQSCNIQVANLFVYWVFISTMKWGFSITCCCAWFLLWIQEWEAGNFFMLTLINLVFMDHLSQSEAHQGNIIRLILTTLPFGFVSLTFCILVYIFVPVPGLEPCLQDPDPTECLSGVPDLRDSSAFAVFIPRYSSMRRRNPL